MDAHAFFFFFNDTATTEIYTLSLHDALPISTRPSETCHADRERDRRRPNHRLLELDRKSTRLNSSHSQISYAVFCLKKKKQVDVSAGLAAHDRSGPVFPTLGSRLACAALCAA